MYSEKFEAIIEAALSVGELTDKNREILHKRAIQEGVDVDELDLILNARIAKMKKQTSQAPILPAMSSTKMGNAMKCPQCGAPYEPGTYKCSQCGHLFQNAEGVSSAKKLADGIQELMESFHTGIFSGRLQAGDVHKVSEFIKNFPVPNGKDDMLEFLFSLDAKRKDNGIGAYPQLAAAYSSKYRVVATKAKILFADDPQIMAVVKETSKKSWSNLSLFQKGCILYVIGFIVLWIIIGIIVAFIE